MGGYSQGGQILHSAAGLLSASTMAKVSAAVIFGDPGTYHNIFSIHHHPLIKRDNSYINTSDRTTEYGTPVTGISAAKTLIICHDGDEICAHTDLVLLPHLTYATNAVQAAQFAVSQAGL